MQTDDYTYKELEHIRVLDLSLSAICATIVYLIAANFNHAPEINREISSISSFYVNALQSSFSPDALQEITGIDIISNDILSKQIQRQLSDKLVAELSIAASSDLFHKQALERFSNRPTASSMMKLSNIRSFITSRNWEIEAVDKIIEISIPPDCIAFIKQSKLREAIDSEADWLRRELFQMSIEGREIKMWQWPQSSNQFGMAKMVFGINYRKRSAITKEGAIPFTTTISSHTCELTTLFSTTRTEIGTLLDIWFSREHKNLVENWSILSEKDPSEARRWSRNQRVAGIADQRPVILGIPLGGNARLIFASGFLAIISINIYLNYYLARLIFYCMEKGYINFISPWIGSANGVIPFIASSLTLVLLPLLASFLSVHRILDLEWPWVLLCCGTVLFVGVRNLRMARKLAHRFCEASTSVAQEVKSINSVQDVDNQTASARGNDRSDEIDSTKSPSQIGEKN